MTPEENLANLGLTLPPAPPPVGAYLPALKVGELVFTSGQLPMREGRLVAVGKVSDAASMDQALEGARVAALNALAQVAAVTGGLDRVVRIVRVGVFVNSGPGFTDQAKVANAASELLVGVFGDAGRHVRTAVGVNELPLNAAVEVELIAQIRS
ncbi:MAG TPA: RidA family protein [Phycisphaerae bacterium]|nr:RidA family protein [Phycisphaerae bacterium]HOL27250.1 RidA family protein [Phycisphaerae bacterium]HQA43898.1 RidA family protein [Phycisphaerae bacterium]